MCENDPTNDRLMPSRELLRQFNWRSDPMTAKYISGNQSADVDPENEAAFEAAGWSRVEDDKPRKLELPDSAEKSDK